MAYWLIKSEPSTYSIDDLMRDKQTNWDGVRNFQARNNLKLMNKNDLCLVYHSGDDKAVVGTAKVNGLAIPDVSAKDGDWVMVPITYVKKLTHPVTLAEIKKEASLKNMSLIKQSRLSVMPLTATEYDKILQLSGTKE